MGELGAVAGKMGSVLVYPLAFLFVLTIVVFVHEYGHFIVGRLCGVGVKAFSIGFGREHPDKDVEIADVREPRMIEDWWADADAEPAAPHETDPVAQLDAVRMELEFGDERRKRLVLAVGQPLIPVQQDQRDRAFELQRVPGNFVRDGFPR